MKNGRKLLAVSGAAIITFVGGAAAATGNLMAQPEPRPVKPVKPDAGTAAAADAGTPLQKTEAPAKKDTSKK